MLVGEKLIIGTPSGESINALTMGCMDQLKIKHQGFIANLIGTYVERNQNLIVEAGLKYPSVEYFMFIDSDMLFPNTILDTLFVRNKDIVGCAYRTRQPPHGFAVRHLGGDAHGLGPSATGEETGVREVGFIPSGMMLVKRKVFETLTYPWFFNTYGNKPEDFIGNDVNFCLNARKSGFKIWCDFYASREVAHFGGCAIGYAGIA